MNPKNVQFSTTVLSILVTSILFALAPVSVEANDCCEWAGVGCVSTPTGTGDQQLCEDLGGAWNANNVCVPGGVCEPKDGGDEEFICEAPDEMCCEYADINCAGAIPTVSEWGLIVMTLLLLTAGTIIFGRRRRPAVA